MRKNITPLLAIAFVVAIISTGLFYGLFASKLSNASTDLPRQNVVIASRKLATGAVLAASDVHVAEFRGRTAFAGSFAAPEQVIGSTTTEALEDNQVLTKSSLASRTSAALGSTVPNRSPLIVTSCVWTNSVQYVSRRRASRNLAN